MAAVMLSLKERRAASHLRDFHNCTRHHKGRQMILLERYVCFYGAAGGSFTECTVLLGCCVYVWGVVCMLVLVCMCRWSGHFCKCCSYCKFVT